MPSLRKVDYWAGCDLLVRLSVSLDSFASTSNVAWKVKSAISRISAFFCSLSSFMLTCLSSSLPPFMLFKQLTVEKPRFQRTAEENLSDVADSHQPNRCRPNIELATLDVFAQQAWTSAGAISTKWQRAMSTGTCLPASAFGTSDLMRTFERRRCATSNGGSSADFRQPDLPQSRAQGSPTRRRSSVAASP